ncbi:hypothetical protein [Haloferula sp.]|uniref:hypothetical protein n=1 Tax=Haloferula sp. TaxID=2497595 RepID=UPI003C7969E1
MSLLPSPTGLFAMTAWAALGALTFSQTPETPDEKTKTFPSVFKAPAARLEAVEPPADAVAAWTTRHFLVVSDTPIPPAALQSFANTIESVPAVLDLFPIPLLGLPEGERPLIRLCRDEQGFTELGGPPSSAGYYQHRGKSVLIRADLLLSPQKGGNSKLREEPDEDLLVHELCHLSTSGTLQQAPPWLSEGIAEYLSIAHQRGGFYRFDDSTRFIRNHFKRHLPTKDLANLELPALSHTLKLSHREWSREVAEADITDRYLPYATSLLFVHYLIEGGSSRRAGLREYLTELSAPESRHHVSSDFDLDDPKSVEDKLTRYWTKNGMNLRFSAR